MRMKACTCGSHLSSALYRILFTSLFLSTALCSVALPIQAGTDQQSSASAVTATAVDEKNAPEITSQDVISTFKVDVNLVTVRVVVRDAHGRPVRNLRREQFRIFDEGKSQSISRFSVEETAAPEPERAAGSKQAGRSTPSQLGETTSNPALPDRYVAIVMDDINTNAEDLIRAKQAADKHLVEAALRNARVAIFSASGATTLDFTDDREKLRHALSRVQPRSPARANVASQCPYMNYYLADLIINRNDQRALAVVVDDLQRCMHTKPRKQDDELARAAAMSELQAGAYELRTALLLLQDVIRRMSALPGQRTVLLVSPGFLLGDRHIDSVEVMDRAIRSKVTINALDARGLYVDTAFKPDYSGPVSLGLLDYQLQSDRVRADVLQALADATGGTFFHNTNDLSGGMRELAAPPEYTYILAFSPQGLKHDGRYHTLKVTVTEPDLKVTARHGYYAPKGSTDPEQARRRDIEDVLFSRQEIREIPVKLHSEYFKSAGTVKLSVVSRVDVTSLSFRKEAGRNCDDVTVVSALFDRNGKLIDGIEKIIELRLRDQTLHRLHSGIAVKSSFDVNPGSYVIRVVVRDAEGRKLSAASTAIDIP